MRPDNHLAGQGSARTPEPPLNLVWRRKQFVRWPLLACTPQRHHRDHHRVSAATHAAPPSQATPLQLPTPSRPTHSPHPAPSALVTRAVAALRQTPSPRDCSALAVCSGRTSEARHTHTEAHSCCCCRTRSSTPGLWSFACCGAA